MNEGDRCLCGPHLGTHSYPGHRLPCTHLHQLLRRQHLCLHVTPPGPPHCAVAAVAAAAGGAPASACAGAARRCR
eukprot:357924-Chlamydomonas_euryale.AAC.9